MEQKDNNTLEWLAILGIIGYLVYEHHKATGRWPWQSGAVQPGGLPAPSSQDAAASSGGVNQTLPTTQIPVTITPASVTSLRSMI